MARIDPNFQLTGWCPRCQKPFYTSRFMQEGYWYVRALCSCHPYHTSPPARTKVEPFPHPKEKK